MLHVTEKRRPGAALNVRLPIGMSSILYIFIGGGTGSVLRFLAAHYTRKLWSGHSFPAATFLTNITGCFLTGVFLSCFLKREPYLQYLLVTGFCGGFTTFSAFSYENYSLWQSGKYALMIVYSLLSVLIGLLAVFGGFQAVKKINFTS